MSDNIIKKSLIEWYLKYKRDLPWRNTKNPYLIWVSEIILQQTRIAQGLPYYERFSSLFPTIESLAQADISDVLRLWQGLGYYSRARNMHFAANQILEEFNGVFPNSYVEIIKLKGIGSYTAAAIASFAFDEVVPVVDGNVFRVLSRLFCVDIDIASSNAKKHFFELGKQIISHEDPATFNQAIMEFGSLHCTPFNPKCNPCPLSISCLAFKSKKVGKYPIKNKKIKTRIRYFNYAVLNFNGNFIMNERTEKGIWQGLYDFPLFESKNTSCTEEEMLEWIIQRYHIKPHNIELKKVSKKYKHILSHQHIYAVFYTIHIKNKIVNANVFKNNYTFGETLELPKPILIDNYLKESIF